MTTYFHLESVRWQQQPTCLPPGTYLPELPYLPYLPELPYLSYLPKLPYLPYLTYLPLPR